MVASVMVDARFPIPGSNSDQGSTFEKVETSKFVA